MNNRNEKWLFWASFFTLIAAGVGFSIRGDIQAAWGRDFGFTQTELGEITGMGLMGFGLTIIFFSFFADLVGYGKLMVIGFLLHAASVVITLAAPWAYKTSGREGAYWCLYIGQFCFSLANGTCEAVINPLTARLFPTNKTHWLNILHAGWPGGLVLGAMVSLGLNQIGGVGWQIRWGVLMAPTLLYGLMMLGRRFPTSETKAHGVDLRQMMGEVGILGAAVVTFFLGIWFSRDLAPGLGVPGYWGWVAAAVIWVIYGFVIGFSLGHFILTFLYLLHALIGYVELGTDSWIIEITKITLVNSDTAQMTFIWTNVLMFTLRFFAGPIVHKISPVGLLFASAVIGATGLYLLGQPFTNTTMAWLAAVTVYGIGKTFYWPTMLGVISERFPKGGALALGISGGVGMLSAGLLGGPLIGYKQDYSATHYIQEKAPETYRRYKSDTPKAPLPYLEEVAGLDNAKVGVLDNYMALKTAEKSQSLTPEQKKLDLEKDLEILAKDKRQDVNLANRMAWWNSVGQEHADLDSEEIKATRLHGGKTALRWTAAVPAAMAIGYLLLIFVFKAMGGYKQLHLGESEEAPTSEM